MTPKATILADLARGNIFFAKLIDEEIASIKFGTCSNPNDCEGVNNCLYYILESLQFRVDNDLLDETTELLYIELILIIGSASASTMNVYWGFKPTGDILSYEDILLGNLVVTNIGANVVIPYRVTDLNRLWFAVPATESIKNYFQDLGNPDNKGTLGAEDEFYGIPTLVSGAINLNFYITNWVTVQNTNLLFKRV